MIIERKFVLHFSTLICINFIWPSYANQLFNEVIHFIQAVQEYEISKDQLKFDLHKNSIKEYYNTGVYDNEIESVCKEAESHFLQLDVHEKSLIIFDIDDTSIRLYPCLETTLLGINMPATKIIIPVLNLYKLLIAKGFKIIFITGRPDHFLTQTKNELEESGYCGYIDLICMPYDLWKNNTRREFVGEWKLSIRKKLAAQYDIVGSIGDRDIDFFGGYSGKIIKLPNYLY